MVGTLLLSSSSWNAFIIYIKHISFLLARNYAYFNKRKDPMSIKLKSFKYVTETCKIFNLKYLHCWQIFYSVINVDTAHFLGNISFVATLKFEKFGRSKAIFGGTHKASPTLSQGKRNIITVITTITVQKPFYYFYGILVLTYRLRLITLSSSIWISCVRQLYAVARLNSCSDRTTK